MQSPSNFEEMLQAFNDAGVRFLVVGAYAVAAHSRPRATGDIDIWVERSEDNARRIYEALAHFGRGRPGRGRARYLPCKLRYGFAAAPSSDVTWV
jgi:hypothetical protein